MPIDYSGSEPIRIVSGGVHRSGSTWCFNALRYILESAKLDFYSDWVGDYDANNPVKVHLVKTHYLDKISWQADAIICSTRPTVESVASLRRMEWLADNDQNLLERFISLSLNDRDWRNVAHYTVEYSDARANPEKVLNEMAHAIGLKLDEKKLLEINEKLENLKRSKKEALDLETHIHPNHVGTEQSRLAFEADTVKRLRIAARKLHRSTIRSLFGRAVNYFRKKLPMLIAIKKEPPNR